MAAGFKIDAVTAARARKLLIEGNPSTVVAERLRVSNSWMRTLRAKLVKEGLIQKETKNNENQN